MEFNMTCDMSEIREAKMPNGLDLEIIYHPMRMKSLVNLVIAIERLKSRKSASVLCTEFRDENLLSIMLESIVEEQIVFPCGSAPTDQFSRTGEHQCSMTDSQKRNLILNENSMELNAVMLQGGSDSRKVNLNMSTYVHPSPTTEAQPVALAIKGTNLYLSCHSKDGRPTLHLEVVGDKNTLSSISSESEMMRFLFYKRDTGLNISTIMSARFPDWYVSTAEQDNKPVEMCMESANRYRTFNVQRQS
ncbi:interleukin-1 beta-like [Mastacembelus armatus]|nr:interleukin-1 beta-like [Mastacembelus armatus]XP_026177196.1 interleukin-1 beta-like [Mastacembelus armatus]